MNNSPQLRRRGRPLRDPTAGERVGMSMRVTPLVKLALERTVKLSGRSLSQEIELRLSQSLRDDEIIARLDRLEASIKALGACLVALVNERRAA